MNTLQIFRIPQTEAETLTDNRQAEIPIELQGAVFNQLLHFTGWGGGKFRQIEVKAGFVVWERFDERGDYLGTFKTKIFQNRNGAYQLCFDSQEQINNNLNLNSMDTKKVKPLKPTGFNDKEPETAKPTDQVKPKTVQPLRPTGF